MRNRQAPSDARRPLGHAVVLGGSMAGLLAARALSPAFARVTIVERDALAADALARKGVPQGSHLHALLARGQRIAERLLPGLRDELTAAGAEPINAGQDLSWHAAGGWRARYESDIDFLSMSCPLLESAVAGRIRALPNVTILDGLRTDGLLADGTGIVGVAVSRPGTRDGTREIACDLVVDAMGRGSATTQWLNERGLEAPPADLVGARVAYATTTFRRSNAQADWRALIVSGNPSRRSGLIFPIEGERWLVTLPGFFDEAMPHDRDGFLAYAASLAVPDLHAAIRDLEPLSEIKRHRFVGSLRRRYERLRHVPAGLIAIGDAVCSFNPIYGQGMTVAAIEAETLALALAEARIEGGIGSDFARTWFASIAPAIDAAWNGVLLEDFRFPELASQRPLSMRPKQWYMGRVQRATHRSAYATDRFYRVMNFLAPPTTLFSPRMVVEALRAGSGSERAPERQRQEDPAQHRKAAAKETVAMAGERD